MAAGSKVTFSRAIGPRFKSRHRQILFLRIILSTLWLECPKACYGEANVSLTIRVEEDVLKPLTIDLVEMEHQKINLLCCQDLT